MTLPQEDPTIDRHEHVEVDRSGPVERAERVVDDINLERRARLLRITQLIWLLFAVLETLIGIRVVLKLIAANPASPFANFIYNITSPFLAPFFGLTATPAAGGVVLEIPSIIAIVIYALLGWLIVRLVWLLFYRPSTRSVTTIHRRDDL